MASRYFKYLSFMLIVLWSCGRNRTKTVNMTPSELRDPLINANKMYVQQESDEINQYIKHKKWEMKETGTGLRYMIYHEGKGEKATTGKFAKVSYKISLLDGTVCYSSEEKGPKEFLIGRDNVESGLHEGILYLSVGDKALLILPSHLAHGLVGDDNKIPPRSSVVFDIELLSLR